jgi:hypothetical protein
MYEWTSSATERLAASIGADTAAYALTDGDIETLLDLARVAAHDSGAKSNAPLICYLVGLAHGRNPDRELSPLTRAVTEGSTPVEPS